jgi:hypothetical protein
MFDHWAADPALPSGFYSIRARLLKDDNQQHGIGGWQSIVFSQCPLTAFE